MSKILSLPELLKLANEHIRVRPGFVEGMQIHEAEMKGPFLVMRVPYYQAVGTCLVSMSGESSEEGSGLRQARNGMPNG
jgi:hypothetical protein